MNAKKLITFSAMSLTLACAETAMADTFSNGQFVTYTQSDWGSGGVSASILSANYDTVYASQLDELILGVTGNANQHFMEFTGPAPMLAYLPSSGPAGPLTLSFANPQTTPSGIFGGDVVALRLDVDFDNAGLLGRTSSVPFGDLVLTDMGVLNLSSLNGVTVNQFLADANSCLSGGACPLTDRPELGLSPLDFTDSLTDDLSLSFDAGTPDAFADDHLALPATATAPEPSSLLLLGPALAGIALLRRRFVRSSAQSNEPVSFSP